ncbi:DUF6398 domain-containing protein [Bathymodiolus platifrons methanotrophic gill symbiont]|uniref:DUF6398 domain-containing protein n=1 Tax=Bathymodiolus platifrons methanotrophic gill symbiont TaxID=113268 RepID=UPI001FCE0AB8|nr:DUF6398 domain-containing protein [Bathymodiolus platifrons methanotrophic gill symbiont]
MGQVKKSENVPKSMQEKYKAIVELTDCFSEENLNEEYTQLIRYAVAALCRKRPSPLEKGKANSWACGVTHAIGMVNFLFDKSQTPHIGAADLYEKFGVARNTGQGKSKTIRDYLGMYQSDPNWTLASNLDSNLMAWMLSVNGMIVDIRTMSREAQEIALEQGLIPYIPDDEL